MQAGPPGLGSNQASNKKMACPLRQAIFLLPAVRGGRSVPAGRWSDGQQV
ncbi:MAG: hypothetical protein IPL60_05145 [Ardenticatenia bacterium]|nr:hypothetical protein [Ardenticatenia bacterium]